MRLPVADDRILRGAAASIGVTWTDQYGEAAAAGGAVTVRVQKADGTDVVAAGSSTTGANPYLRALTAAQTATTEQLVATWTDASNSATRTTRVEIAERFFFSRTDASDIEATLSNTTKYPAARFRDVRRQVEDECERVTGMAWVPRYARATVDGTGDPEVLLPHLAIRSVRSVRSYTSPTTYTAYTAAEVAQLIVKDDGRIIRPDGLVFAEGVGNLVVEYEHGQDRPPFDLLQATVHRLRYRLNSKFSIEWAEASTYRAADGGSYDMGTVEDDVEQRNVFRVYMGYAKGRRRPASRTLDFDPQRHSIFHGGRR